MKNKLKFLVKMSLLRKVKTKWFIVAQIAFLILLVCLLNIDVIINAFGGDFESKTEIYIVDETETTTELLIQAMDINEDIVYGDNSNNYEYITDMNIEESKEIIKDNNGIIIWIKDSSSDIVSVELISNKTINTYDYSIIYNSLSGIKLTLIINQLGLTDEEIRLMTSDVDIVTTTLDKESSKTKEENTDMIMNTVFPIIILPIFMLSIYLVQMIGAEVNDEKTTKAMEVIISNVSPKTHFFAKVIAGNLFVLIQTLLLFAYTSLGFLIRKLVAPTASSSISNMLSTILDVINNSALKDKFIFLIPLMIILIILTFLAYSLVAGVLASMTTNTEDFQQMQTPIMLISVIGYYLATTAGMFEGSVIIKILSYVPFISAILSPSLLVLGQITIYDVGISIVVLIISNYLLIKYGLKIYKAGILNYSSNDLWKKMFKALKE